MDEPMEEGAGVVSSTSEPSKQPNRGCRMMMVNLTEEIYLSEYWPRLELAVNQLLTMVPNQYIAISYEQMYSCVYKCVCKQFSERLYNDLIKLITDHCENMCTELQSQAKDHKPYVEKFSFCLNQYLQALSGIVPIFNYMNRFYVSNKLKTDLMVVLKNLFLTTVSEKHIPVVLPILVDLISEPFAISPSTMSSLIKNLYELKPGYANLRPHLFARYIPSILPAASERDLDYYIEETKRMQRDLMTHPMFVSGDQSRKRRVDDDVPGLVRTEKDAMS